MQPIGRPIRNLLRLEALAVCTAGLLVWAGLDGGWVRFALFILIPDVSIIGYLWNSRIGAATYNVAHSYALPLLIGVVGGMLDNRTLLLTGALWMTHIGIDRVLGFGLKYASGFRDTHLGTVGRPPIPETVRQTGEHLVGLLNSSNATDSALASTANAPVQSTH